MALILLSLFGTAFATYIDFTALSPSPPNIQPSPYIAPMPGGTITISAFNLLTFEAEKLWWDSTDGFGVYGSGYENDEIEFPEVMSISFSSPVYVSYFNLTDLFIEGISNVKETGLYMIDGNPGSLQPFSQNDPNVSNGEYMLLIDQTISEIWFSAFGKIFNNQNHEFSVAGVEVAPVSEPSTMILLGCVLIVFGSFRRNKFKK